MKIKFFKLSELDKNLKASIHKTGKLGFTREAAVKLKLAQSKSADIGVNDDDPNDKNLYLVTYSDHTGAFKVIKAGEYYYINTKVLFDNLKLNYAKETIVFDISEQVVSDLKLFVLAKREKVKKEKEGMELFN